MKAAVYIAHAVQVMLSDCPEKWDGGSLSGRFGPPALCNRTLNSQAHVG